VPQVMTAQVAIAQVRYHLVPVRGIAQDPVEIRPPRGPVKRRAIGSSLMTSSRLCTSGRISPMIGTRRARLPLVPLSISPPGPGVV
jgi:hypothetical protein